MVAIIRRECDLELEEYKKTISYLKAILQGKESENEAFVTKIR